VDLCDGVGGWWVIGGDIVTGEIDEEQGDPLEIGFVLGGANADVDVGVVGVRRLLIELVSLISVRSSSSLSLFSSELLRVSAASRDFLCMPRTEIHGCGE
jgi:hypothetical protein